MYWHLFNLMYMSEGQGTSRDLPTMPRILIQSLTEYMTKNIIHVQFQRALKMVFSVALMDTKELVFRACNATLNDLPDSVRVCL